MSKSIVIPSSGTIYDVAGEQAGFLREAAERIRNRHSRVTTEMIEIGTELSAVKERTNHGLFLGWLEHEVNMEPRLAQKYMRAAEWAPENAKLVSHLQPTAVMDLAAKSTPPAVIQAVVRKVDAGEKVSPTIVRRLMSAAREERLRLAEEERKSPSARKAVAERRAKEKAEHERRAAKHDEEERAHEAKATQIRRELARALVAHLPDDVVEMLIESLQSKWGERDLRIWEKRIFCGTFTAPMVDEIRAARTPPEKTDGIMDLWVREAKEHKAEERVSDDTPDFVPAFLKAG